MKKPSLYRSWLTHFALYNLIFLGLQIGFIFSKSSNFFINTIPLPNPVYIELIITVFIHISLYLLLSALQTSLLWGLVQYHLRATSLQRWHITIWSLSICALLTSNGYLFPLSMISRLFLPELPHMVLVTFMLFSLLILSSLLLNTLFFACKRYPLVSCGTLLIFAGLLSYGIIKPTINNELTTKANIILIGVDSLSPSYVSKKNTPTLAQFIDESVSFKEAISPLARTYPAWSSILTGLYPQHHGARYNLMPPDLVKSERSIAWLLQEQGYQTIFATDDRRFSNIGNEFGFQKIIGPKRGVNDFLLGTFNDYPLSNLLVNLPISQWLFPYNYTNRASHFTYYPRTFDKLLHDSLKSNNNAPPFFMAVHFTLPHAPYAWAISSPEQVKDEYSVKEKKQLYLAALQQADAQVAQLLNVLQQYGYLENSLVVLLSDHGEALYLKGARQTSKIGYQGQGTGKFVDYLKRKTSTELDMSVGHGSDLLSPDQYRCVLAFKIYKHNQLTTTPKIINTRVALIDLTPTIQAFLGIPAHQSFDGVSLLNTLVNNESLSERFFIMESGMLPNQILTQEKVRFMGQKFFTINPKNGQLHLRKSELATLDALKLYAVIKGPWILALYPDDNGYIPITLNLNDGKWTDDLNTDFVRKSPATSMLNYLQTFYKRKWVLVSDYTEPSLRGTKQSRVRSSGR